MSHIVLDLICEVQESSALALSVEVQGLHVAFFEACHVAVVAIVGLHVAY